MNLEIIELIKRRRLQMLVHSRIYYEMDLNIIDDRTWSRWAMELVKLQEAHPEESKEAPWTEAFEDWDGSTGAFLPLKDPWIVNKANYIATICDILPKRKVAKTTKIKAKTNSHKLF